MKLHFAIFLFTFLLQISCKEKLEKEFRFFDIENLDSGNVKLLIYRLEGSKFQNDFYIDDINVLKTMQNQWIFTKKSKIWSCGFDHRLVLMDGNKIVQEKLINLDCEYMSGWIYFPKEYLLDNKSNFKE